MSNIFLRLIRSIIAPLIFAHAGGRHRRRRRSEAHGPHRRQGHPLLRNRHHAGAVSGPGRGEPGAARARACRSSATAAEAAAAAGASHARPPCWSTSSPPASSTPWRATTCCRSWSSRSCSAPPARPSAPRPQPVVAFCESLAEVMFRYTQYVMYLAPLGVGAAIAVTVGSKGVGVLFGLGKLIAHHVRVARCSSSCWCWAPVLLLFRIPAAALLPRRARAVPDRLLHRIERSRAAAGARKHGSSSACPSTSWAS